MHRILIVEDNPVDQRLFEQALSDPMREIEICSDGREALAAFERRSADVVISDILMPNRRATSCSPSCIAAPPTCRYNPGHPLRQHLGRGDGDACGRVRLRYQAG
jgi:CheY-like chemotaxis protein